MTFKKNTLENGLRIITVPMKNTETVTVLVLVGAGSKYETKEINGISHFLEHLFFKGTKKRPNTLKISEVLDKVGGNYNAFTDKEFTGYFAKVPSKYFDLALDWISDIFLNSKFESREIEKEKGVLIEEMNMYYDTPIKYVGDLFEKLLYQGQPAGWLIIGEKENIKKIKTEEIINYYKNHYSALNTVICVSGKVGDAVEKKIKNYFRNIRPTPPLGKLKVIEKQNQPQVLTHLKETEQTHLCLGVRAYDLNHPLRYALEILSIILGGNMSSRLFISLRAKKGLCYYIQTTSHFFIDSGYLVTQAGVPNEKVNEVIKSIIEEYKSIKNKKISDLEIKKAKDYYKGALTLSLEGSDDYASFYSFQELLSGRILTPKEKFAKIDKVAKRDILEVASDIFQPEKLNLALIGPHKEKKVFENLLYGTNF